MKRYIDYDMILISKKDELGSNFVQWELFFEEPKPIFIRSLIVNEKSSVGTFFEEPKPIFYTLAHCKWKKKP